MYEYYNYRPNSEGVLERVEKKRQIIAFRDKEVLIQEYLGWKPTCWKSAFHFVPNAYRPEPVNNRMKYKKNIPAQWTGKKC